MERTPFVWPFSETQTVELAHFSTFVPVHTLRPSDILMTVSSVDQRVFDVYTDLGRIMLGQVSAAEGFDNIRMDGLEPFDPNRQVIALELRMVPKDSISTPVFESGTTNVSDAPSDEEAVREYVALCVVNALVYMHGDSKYQRLLDFSRKKQKRAARYFLAQRKDVFMLSGVFRSNARLFKRCKKGDLLHQVCDAMLCDETLQPLFERAVDEWQTACAQDTSYAWRFQLLEDRLKSLFQIKRYQATALAKAMSRDLSYGVASFGYRDVAD